MPARQVEVRITNSGYPTLVIVMFGEGSPMATLQGRTRVTEERQA
jgi:hypothetical protein